MISGSWYRSSHITTYTKDIAPFILDRNTIFAGEREDTHNKHIFRVFLAPMLQFAALLALFPTLPRVFPDL